MQNVQINLLGIFENQVKYKIVIGDETFDYSTGLGWCKTKREEGTKVLNISNLDKATKIKICKALGPMRRVSYLDLYYLNQVYVKLPSVDDILECLFSDADCGAMSFIEFCDELGYNSDSIKDFKVYQACMETTVKVRKLVRQGLISRKVENETV